jgi:hypothetical protein
MEATRSHWAHGQLAQDEVDQARDEAELESSSQQLDRSPDGELSDSEPIVGDRSGVLGVLCGEQRHGEPSADSTDEDSDEGAGG